jgi:hypothetical protein
MAQRRFFIEGPQAGVFYEGMSVNAVDAAGLIPADQQQDQNDQFAIPVMQVPAKYYNSIVIKSNADYIESNCAEITFFNNAPTTFSGLIPDGSIMVINNMQFPPGASISFDGKAGEIDTTRYQISFIAPGANVAVIIRKLYL